MVVLCYMAAISSVQFSHSVVSNSLGTHGLQHARLPCPSPTPRACSNSRLSSQWCHPTISPSVIPFSSCLQSFPASGSFPRSQFFASGGQSIGASASASACEFYGVQFQSVQSLSCVWLFATTWTAAPQASLSITKSRSLLKLMSIESVMPSNHLTLCHPLLLLPSVFPSIRVFSKESVLCIKWLKYWSFNFSISPSNEYSGLISFRIDWFHLLAEQGTLKSLLQYHSSKASILQCSAFFIVQLSHLYMTTGKIIALTRYTFVSKVMSLLFNTLSRLL